MLNWILDVLRGAVMGIANIIPGVSGGTMAVSMGIYDRMIYAVNNIVKKFKESLKTLLPIVIGMLIGLFAFAALIGHLLGTDIAECYKFRILKLFPTGNMGDANAAYPYKTDL